MGRSVSLAAELWEQWDVHTPETARMMVDISSVIFWPLKSYLHVSVLAYSACGGDLLFGLRRALELVEEAHRPYRTSCS